MYARTLFNWLVPPLRPIEKAILSSVEAKLSPPLATLFRAQIAEINYVQRRLDGREVGLYVIKSGRVGRDQTLSFQIADREWRLARVRVERIGTVWIASVHLVDGYLSSIEYDGPPPAASSDEVSLSIEIFEPPSRAPRSSSSAPSLPPWLQAYANRFEMKGLEPPLTIDDRTAILERFESRFPADYIDFVATCDGVQIGSLSLLGLREAYETRTDDGGFIILGEMGGKGALAVRKPGPTTVFIDYEYGSITEVGSSLQAAVEHIMSFNRSLDI